MGKKRHKYDEYVDLGAGYDENDSFIDNTDAVREVCLFTEEYSRGFLMSWVNPDILSTV